MVFKINVKQKIIFSILIIGLMAEIVGLSTIFFIGKDSLKRSIGETFQELAKLTSDRLELLIEHHIEEAFSLASSDKVLFLVETSNELYIDKDEKSIKSETDKIENSWKGLNEDSKELKTILNNKASNYLRDYSRRYDNRLNSGIHHNIIITDNRGMVVASSIKTTHYNYSNKKWWKAAFNEAKGNIYFSDIAYDEELDKYLFNIAEPIKKNGKTIGVFFMMHNVYEFFGWVTSVKLGSTDHTMLASDDGMLLFCPIYPIGTHILNKKLQKEIFKKEAGWGVTTHDVHYENETINGFAPVALTTTSIDSNNFDGKRWFIFTSQDPNETYAPVYRLLKWIIITGIAGILLWLGLGWIVANNIVRPIRELQRGVEIIGNGDLDHSIVVKSHDEIGSLANDFNDMAKKLKKYYQELEQLSILKSEFVSKVSHELRTPLTSIKGFVEILLTYQDIDEKTNDEFLTIISEESNRLTRLINDLLDLSKIESGKVEWTVSPINLLEVVDFSIRSMKVMASGKKIIIKSNIPDNLPLVNGNKDLLIQVLDNLINNAIKFTEDGEIIIAVKDLVDHTLISVTDTGIGILEDDREKIFEKFHQVGNVYTDKPSGTGLGLPISKEIITNFGGAIWCESKIDVGSVFFFTLPLANKGEIKN